MIKINNIRIDDYGDESVGIFPCYWEITGDMFFDNDEELKYVIDSLISTFELITDNPKITYDIHK